MIKAILTVAALTLSAAPTLAQWDPANGQWLKSDATDVRVMTYNVQDGICRTADKSNGQNSWNALARTVAALQPDVLILQETGDNSGNGTGSGVDSTNQLNLVGELFMHGGNDPFNGGTIGAYVQLFAPGYDLPFITSSRDSDGFNRNLIMSRFPPADLNGDGISIHDDFLLNADAWQSGGDGGIRGFAFIEYDLPDATYAGDLVVGNSHLKAGSGSSDFTQRRIAAQNIAYLIEFMLNGNGTGTSDPNASVRSPNPPDLLDPNTPVVWGGDWNQTPSSTGPNTWMTQAVLATPNDGTDRDGTPSVHDTAAHPLTGDTSTQSSSKLDYLAWQDSIATARREFIFRTSGSGLNSSNFPPAITGFPRGWAAVSGFASDHRPVIVDLQLPLVQSCPADLNEDGVVDNGDIGAFIALFLAQDLAADFNSDGILDNGDIAAFIAAFLAGC